MQGKLHKTGIVGARGYSGLELARLLLKHPSCSLEACFATSADWRLSDFLPEPEAQNVQVHPMSNLHKVAAELDVVFLATPPEVSLELAPELLKLGADVIDLSGAFRANSDRAQYGLVPWVGPARSGAGGVFIANPGCYATSVLMALIPLLRARVIRPETLVIDAKSGTSGAGRKAQESLLFTEVDGECLPYRVGKHQHLPEIKTFAEKFSGVAVDPMFTTSLLPVRRGIISGLYAKLEQSLVASGRAKSLEAISKAYAGAYADYPLVNHGPTDSHSNLLSLKRVVGSARTQISYEVQDDKLYVFSCIDNLMKGAASQAVENFNRLIDQPVSYSLTEWKGIL